MTQMHFSQKNYLKLNFLDDETHKLLMLILSMFASPPFIFSFTPSFVSMTNPSLLLCPSPLPEGKDYPNYPFFFV